MYASFEACNNHPLRCIAPTIKKARCLISISATDRNEAAKLLLQAQNLPDSDERDDLIAKFVLLHCCHRHNWRLKADDTGCWDKIVKNYGLEIGRIRPISITEKEATQTSEGEEMQTTHDIAKISHMAPVLLISQASVGMTLRSGMTIDPAMPRRYCDPLDYFIPFEPEPGESMLGQLFEKLDEDWPEEGEIYSFVWPEHPDFVKIGYSAWSALGRVQEWQGCNPGATLSKSVFIEYPKTIERLIHLELLQDRYRIAKCKKCDHSHEEWFKLPIEKVNQVISDWKQVIRRETLYDEDRKLTQEWRHRISELDGGITARALLDMLDAEEQCIQEPVPKVDEVIEELSRIDLSAGWVDDVRYTVSLSNIPAMDSGGINDLHSASITTHRTGLDYNETSNVSARLAEIDKPDSLPA